MRRHGDYTRPIKTTREGGFLAAMQQNNLNQNMLHIYRSVPSLTERVSGELTSFYQVISIRTLLPVGIYWVWVDL